MFQKELTLIKQVNQKNVCFVIISTLKTLVINFNHNVCNGFHAVSMMAYELKNIAILNAKVVDYRCILLGISRDEAVNMLNNSVLKDKGVLQMDFGANQMPAEVIKDRVFGGTYFRDIYSSVTGKWYKKSWLEFDQ